MARIIVVKLCNPGRATPAFVQRFYVRIKYLVSVNNDVECSLNSFNAQNGARARCWTFVWCFCSYRTVQQTTFDHSDWGPRVARNRCPIRPQRARSAATGVGTQTEAATATCNCKLAVANFCMMHPTAMKHTCSHEGCTLRSARCLPVWRSSQLGRTLCCLCPRCTPLC